MGSEIAFDLAVEHPDAVTCVVSVSGGPTPPAADLDCQSALRSRSIERSMENEGIEAANELELQLWLDGDRGPGGCDRRDPRRDRPPQRRPARAPRNLNFDAPEPDPPARERLDHVGPILAVVGAHDQPVGARARPRARGGGCAAGHDRGCRLTCRAWSRPRRSRAWWSRSSRRERGDLGPHFVSIRISVGWPL